MLINCESCKKKFIVPDSAITESGRLVQCSSCGNKWTQYPIQESAETKTNKSKILPKTSSVKKINKPKKKRQISLYSEEYLKKKHGVELKDEKQKEKKKDKSKSTKFGFYSYLILIFIFLISIFSLIHLTKEILIFRYPFTEIYINYLYEVIDIMKTFANDLLKSFL